MNDRSFASVTVVQVNHVNEYVCKAMPRPVKYQRTLVLASEWMLQWSVRIAAGSLAKSGKFELRLGSGVG